MQDMRIDLDPWETSVQGYQNVHLLDQFTLEKAQTCSCVFIFRKDSHLKKVLSRTIQ